MKHGVQRENHVYLGRPPLDLDCFCQQGYDTSGHQPVQLADGPRTGPGLAQSHCIRTTGMWAGQVTGKDTGAIGGGEAGLARLRSRKRPQGPPRDRGRRFPGRRPGQKASSRLPPRPHPAATPASSLPAPARRPGDTRAGRGGAAKVPRSPQRPAPSAPPAPRLPHLALLAAAAAAAASSGPAGSDADAQAQTARGHMIAGERSAARSEAREVVPETRVGVGGREGLPGISEDEHRRTRPGRSFPRPCAAGEPQHTWRWFCTGLP